jgi:L-lactate dehydrogenase complex protein LldG
MIQQRETFLNNIAAALGREVNKTKKPERNWKYNPQAVTLTDLSQDELVQLFKAQCVNIHTDYVETTAAELKAELSNRVDSYGGGPVSLWKDERFDTYGLGVLLREEWPQADVEVNEWDIQKGADNIKFAEKANVGITFSDITLAESATVVLFSNGGQGRSVSLLPQTYIAIIPKSTLVPRMTQAAQAISKKVQSEEAVPPCINFISGPSNSADIEMNLVVGVHGPVKATYIIVEDR